MSGEDNRIRALEETVKDLLEVLRASFAPSPFVQQAIADAESVLYRDFGETKFYGELVHPAGMLIVSARVQGRELFIKTGPPVNFKNGEDAVFTQLHGGLLRGMKVPLRQMEQPPRPEGFYQVNDTELDVEYTARHQRLSWGLKKRSK